MKGIKLTQEQFIERMEESPQRDIEGNPYDYSLAIYKGNNTKVKVICKIHGDWEIRPCDLKSGKGCLKCGRIRTSEKRSAEAKKLFKTKASKVHDNKYDYSSTIYLNTRTKVEIICPIHGSFWQKPVHHLSGNGCRACKYEAQAKAHTGSNNPNWIEDRSKLVDGKRIGGMTTWSNSIKRGRDHCDCCEIQFSLYTPPLQKIAHHLNSYDSFPELRLEPSNGVCLCEACHKSFHHVYGYGKNTVEQYETFKSAFNKKAM